VYQRKTVVVLELSQEHISCGLFPICVNQANDRDGFQLPDIFFFVRPRSRVLQHLPLQLMKFEIPLQKNVYFTTCAT
jgi:hypothetical protein